MPGKTRRDLIADRYGVLTDQHLASGPGVVALAPTKLLENSPNRLEFVVINNGTGRLWLYPSNAVSTTLGVVLAAGGGEVDFNWLEDFDLVGYEWWAIAEIAATPYTCFEVVAR